MSMNDVEYKYKSIILDCDGWNNDLNDYFNDGWEYVNSTPQHVSITGKGDSYSSEEVKGKILVIVRKIKD